jgi:O-antigen ligase/tetratricopeptide (TPR) repeat protein
MPSDHRTTSFRPSGTAPGRTASGGPLTLLLVDLGLLLTLIAAPFFMGGRQPLGQLVLCSLATLTALAWCLHAWTHPQLRWRWSGAEPLLLAGLGLILFQTVEIGPEWMQLLSPALAERLPMWGEEGPFGPWNRISVTPAATWSNLIVIVACVVTFLVAVQRVRTPADVRRMLGLIGFGGAMMAVFGLLQLVAGNDRFFWFYEHPMSTTQFKAKGAFTNANHFANLLAMSLPIQLYFIVLRLNAPPTPPGVRSGGFSSRPKRSFDLPLFGWSLAMGASGVAILLSISRGGIVFALAGVLVMLAVLWKKSLLPTKAASVVGGLAILSLTGTLLFGDMAVRMVEQNFVELTSADIDQLDKYNARRKIWEANLEGIREFPILGTGLGSHSEVYWMWFNHPHSGKEFSHAENGYLQIGLETGLVGLGIVGLLILMYAFWCLRGLWRTTTPETVGAVGAVTACLVVTLTHSLSDFVWYAPACVNVVLMCAVCASALGRREFEQRHGPGEEKRSTAGALAMRGIWGGAIPATLLLGAWMFSEKYPEVAAADPWQEYVRRTLAWQNHRDADFESNETLLRRRMDLVLSAAEAHPEQHRVQLHAGMACLRLFVLSQIENGQQMPLSQIRDAAFASFTSREEMLAWLDKPGVMGQSRQHLIRAQQHFRKSLELCPTQPRPYLELGELAWLDGLPAEAERDYVKQAVAVRPYDARAQFALGRMNFEAGDRIGALHHWKEAFRVDASYRRQIVEALAVYVPARFFLEEFDPDRETLVQLRYAYQESEDREGYRQILVQLAEASVKAALSSRGLEAERYWREAHRCFAELENVRAAYHSAKEAVAANPSSYDSRKIFAMWLYEHGLYEEALEHLTWCIRRHPDRKGLQTYAEKAHLEAQRRSLHAPAAETVPTGIRR